MELSELSGLAPVEPLDLDIYRDPGEARPIPPAGRYTLRTADSISFDRTDDGYLVAQIDPVIVGGPYDGYVVRFTRISTKPFQRGGMSASRVGDYLRAVGRRGKLPSDQLAIGQVIASTAGETFTADLDWEAYERASGFRLTGMSNFPPDGSGKYRPYVNSPTEFDEHGEPKRVWANVRIQRFVPKAVD